MKKHFYDIESGTGFLAWHHKTVQRNAASNEKSPQQLGSTGPTAWRDAASTSEKLTEEQCKETISFMEYSADEDSFKVKMKLTYESFDVLTVYKP